jgi:hypothetical protein
MSAIKCTLILSTDSSARSSFRGQDHRGFCTLNRFDGNNEIDVNHMVESIDFDTYATV